MARGWLLGSQSARSYPQCVAFSIAFKTLDFRIAVVIDWDFGSGDHVDHKSQAHRLDVPSWRVRCCADHVSKRIRGTVDNRHSSKQRWTRLTLSQNK